MQLEWDERKAAANLRKHGVSFDEAATALMDPLALTATDEGHYDEVLDVAIGVSAVRRMVLLSSMTSTLRPRRDAAASSLTANSDPAFMKSAPMPAA